MPFGQQVIAPTDAECHAGILSHAETVEADKSACTHHAKDIAGCAAHLVDDACRMLHYDFTDAATGGRARYP